MFLPQRKYRFINHKQKNRPNQNKYHGLYKQFVGSSQVRMKVVLAHKETQVNGAHHHPHITKTIGKSRVGKHLSALNLPMKKNNNKRIGTADKSQGDSHNQAGDKW